MLSNGSVVDMQKGKLKCSFWQKAKTVDSNLSAPAARTAHDKAVHHFPSFDLHPRTASAFAQDG